MRLRSKTSSSNFNGPQARSPWSELNPWVWAEPLKPLIYSEPTLIPWSDWAEPLPPYWSVLNPWSLLLSWTLDPLVWAEPLIPAEPLVWAEPLIHWSKLNPWSLGLSWTSELLYSAAFKGLCLAWSNSQRKLHFGTLTYNISCLHLNINLAFILAIYTYYTFKYPQTNQNNMWAILVNMSQRVYIVQ